MSDLFGNKLGVSFLNFSNCVLVRAKCFVTKSSSLFHPICHFIQFHQIINFYFLPSKIRFDFSSTFIRSSTSISCQAGLDLVLYLLPLDDQLLPKQAGLELVSTSTTDHVQKVVDIHSTHLIKSSLFLIPLGVKL